MKNIIALASLVILAASASLHAATPPEVGMTAANFKLNTLDGKPVELKQLMAEKPVVLVVLRGWPGYQCPLCTRQVNDFAKRAEEFSKQAQVVMIYPGPSENLKAHAQEFLKDKSWPKDFLFVTDPDYTFTKAYDLRWDAKNETAYPSTFIVDKTGKITFAKVSKTHGERTDATAVLAALKQE